MKKLIIFDLDGTLAESKSLIDPEMRGLLTDLLKIKKVAIISGGDWPQYTNQLLINLNIDKTLFKDLSLLPTCGTKYYRYDNDWVKVYSEDFSDSEKEKITSSLNKALAQSGLTPKVQWGELIEDRGSQITFSALGQKAPHHEKLNWDVSYEKRKAIKAILDPMLPEFSIRMGGATSIDVTKAGIDKAYGIRKLRDILGIEIEEMVFVGDAIFPGGNDYPALEAGVVCIPVRRVDDTKIAIRTILSLS